MKKITLSFQVLAAIMAVAPPPSCIQVPCPAVSSRCETPTLSAQNANTHVVTIRTATTGASVRYTLGGSPPTTNPPHGIVLQAPMPPAGWQVTVTPQPTTLKAIAYERCHYPSCIRRRHYPSGTPSKVCP